MKRGLGTTIISLAMVALFTVFMFYILKGFWSFATFFAWGFIIVAVLVDYKVIVDYFKRLFDLLKRNPLYGVGAIAFSVFLYPIVFLVLMLRALGSKFLGNIGIEGLNQQGRQKEEEFTDYEVIEDEEALELKEILKRKS